MSLFGNRLKYVRGNILSTEDGFAFPETRLEEVMSRPSVGVAFSGGGTRAASAALGQLRGLHQLGLLQQARYISAVSGGALTAMPYVFLPRAFNDNTFLGAVLPPERISLPYLTRTDRNSMAHRIANSSVIDDFVAQAMQFAGDETFSRAMGNIFLTPFGISSYDRLFSWSEATRDAILAENAQMRAADFQLARENRPFLITGGLVLRSENAAPIHRIPFEMTPLYVGSYTTYLDAGSNGRPIGGGYVEPHAFDSDEPEDMRQAPPTVRLGPPRHRFTLSDMMGTTAAAPAILAEYGLDFLGFPEFKYWPPAAPKTRAKEYEFGDGGILENLGIMPLLLRKVSKIIVFVNTQHPITARDINGSIPPLFGQTPSFGTNHVFPADQYRTLVGELLAQKAAGKSVLFKDRYTVLENQFWGIEGGWEVEVLWVYNERVDEWEDRLPPPIRDLIGSGSLGNFPHYRTFLQNPPKIIDLSAKQVMMLAHLSCWNILENEAVFKAMCTLAA